MRGGVSSTSLCMSPNDPLLLCRWTCILCKVWVILFAVNVKVPTILDQFLKGKHVLCHREGIWNDLWSDMMIETSCMRFGKGLNGVIGKTTKTRTLKIWAKSQHSCSEALQSLDSIRDS